MTIKTKNELIDHQFKLFTDRIKPRLTMSELQALAAFAVFQKAGDTNSIPGCTEQDKHIQHIGYACSCGSLEGVSEYDDGLLRCLNCGMH